MKITCQYINNYRIHKSYEYRIEMPLSIKKVHLCTFKYSTSNIIVNHNNSKNK